MDLDPTAEDVEGGSGEKSKNPEDANKTSKEAEEGSLLNVSDHEHDGDVEDDWEAEDVDEVEALIEERGAGDGQEENKKVDDDEDRRNPQYIPKKGMFYEHDDRIDSGEEGAEGDKTETAKPARIPRSENVERWGHDKFLEREQQPKTREELVNVYGYDIR